MVEIIGTDKVKEPVFTEQRCPDYDEDCEHVAEPFACWIYSGGGNPCAGFCPILNTK